MWRLVEADFRYNAVAVVLAYAFAAIAFLFHLSKENVPGFVGLTNLALVVALIVMGVREDNEYRERMFALLPLRRRTVAVGRLIFVFLFQAGMFLAWLTLLLVVGDEPSLFWGLLSSNASVLTMILAFVIVFDLGHYGNRLLRPAWILLVALFVFLRLGFMTTDERYRDASGVTIDFPAVIAQDTWLDALLWNVVLAGMTWLAVAVYERRREFLD